MDEQTDRQTDRQTESCEIKIEQYKKDLMINRNKYCKCSQASSLIDKLTYWLTDRQSLLDRETRPV